MLRSIAFAALIVISLAALGGVIRVLDRPVETVIIEGELTRPEQRIVQVALESVELNGLLSTNISNLAPLVSDLDWVRSATVKRSWPDRFIINIEKHEPVARWGNAAYVSMDGNILSVPEQIDDLPMLNAQISAPKQSMETYRLLQRLASQHGLRIQQLSENSQGEWQLVFANSVSLNLGSRQLRPRMKRFLLAYQHSLRTARERIDHVDARYPSGVAIRFADNNLREPELLISQMSDQASQVRAFTNSITD